MEVNLLSEFLSSNQTFLCILSFNLANHLILSLESGTSGSELANHIGQLSAALQQREAQLQVAIKRQHEMADELKKMHQLQQNSLAKSGNEF